MILRHETGSSDIPWRTLVKMGWSTRRIEKVRDGVDTPADERSEGQRRLISEARDPKAKTRRRMQNVTMAGSGTRIRTGNGLRTVR